MTICGNSEILNMENNAWLERMPEKLDVLKRSKAAGYDGLPGHDTDDTSP